MLQEHIHIRQYNFILLYLKFLMKIETMKNVPNDQSCRKNFICDLWKYKNFNN